MNTTTNRLNIPESWGERQRALAGEYGHPPDGQRTVAHDLAALEAAG
jgi:hypothetical protein